MGKLIVELSDEVHRELKKKAADNHKTIKDIITGLVDKYLHIAEKQMPVKETRLCGAWNDERTADEIIKDIKSHRKWLTRQRN